MVNTQRIQKIHFIQKLIQGMMDAERKIIYNELIGEIMDKWNCTDRTAKEYVKAALFKLKITIGDL